MDIKVGTRSAALGLLARRATATVLSISLAVGPLPLAPRAVRAQEAVSPTSPSSPKPAPEALTPSAQEPTPSAGGPASEQGDTRTKAPAEAAPQSQSAATASASGATQDSNFTVPWNASSMRNLTQKPETQAFGAFNQSVEIEVPKFRGLEPKLALRYSSSGSLNAGRLMAGFIGVGWELEGLPDIVRTAPVNGTPRFDASDIYQLDGKDLISCVSGMASPSCATGGTHTGKVESYERIQFDAGSNIWTVTAKDGTRSIFKPVSLWGSTIDSSDNNPNLIKNSYRWLLSERVDTSGNTASYSYACRTLPICYLSSISYNGSEILLIAADHPSYQTRSTGRNIARLDRQLKRIEVRTGGAQVRAYVLTHEASPSTNLQRLKQIQQFGSDWVVDGSNNVSGTGLPPYLYTYYDAQLGYSVGSQVIGTSNQNTYYTSGDFNGDGRSDVLVVNWVGGGTAGICNFNILLSTGTGFSQPQINQTNSGQACFVGVNNTINIGFGYRSADFDGDGISDVYVLYNGGHTVYLTRLDPTTGAISFEKSFVSSNSAYSYHGIQESVADFDGDGAADIVTMSPQVINKYVSGNFSAIPFSSPTTFSFFGGFASSPSDANGDGKLELLNYQNTSSGIYTVTRHSLSGSQFLPLFSYQIYTPELHAINVDADVNGDGVSDIVRYYRPSHSTGPLGALQVYESTGNALSLSATLQPQSYCTGYIDNSSSGEALANSYCGVYATDLDADGRTDIVVTAPGVEGSGNVIAFEAFFNRGGGSWERKLLPPVSIYSFQDLNGDGKPDIIASKFDGELYPSGSVAYATGPIPDLMSSVTSPMGGKATVEYKPSSAWNTTPGTRMPFVTQTVSAVTVADGRGQSARTEYTYRGGRYDFPNRRFLGFAGLTATLPCSINEATCPIVDVSFSQSFAAIGQPITIDRINGAGSGLRRQRETFTGQNTTAPYTALPTSSTVTDYFGDVSRQVRTRRSFNAYGEIVSETRLGDSNRTGDERLRLVDYAPNTAAYIVNRPTRVRTYAGDTAAGTLVADMIVAYDGATSETTPPTRGNPTQLRRWLDTTNSWVTVTKGYDGYGNLTSETDEIGNTTTYAYDAGYHLFVTASTNALGQTTTANWNVTCEQPAERIDLNRQTTTRTYDALCRKTRETRPNNDYTAWSYLDIGQPAAQRIQVGSPAPNNAGGGHLYDRRHRRAGPDLAPARQRA